MSPVYAVHRAICGYRPGNAAGAPTGGGKTHLDERADRGMSVRFMSLAAILAACESHRLTG